MNNIKIILIISFLSITMLAISEETQAIAEEPQVIIPTQVTKQDVINMVKSGVSDEVIVNQIKATNSFIKLTNEEIIELKQAGVSNNLINFIIEIKPYTGIPKGILISTPPPLITTSINYYTYPSPLYYDPWYSYWGWGAPYYSSYWYGRSGGYYYGHHHGGHHNKGHGSGGHGGKH
jgi:hypothetical protein